MKLLKPRLSLTLVVLAAAWVLAGCGQFRHEHAWRDEGPQVVDVRPAQAGKSSVLAPKPPQIMATGYAVVSVQNHRNPAQQRLLASLNTLNQTLGSVQVALGLDANPAAPVTLAGIRAAVAASTESLDAAAAVAYAQGTLAATTASASAERSSSAMANRASFMAQR